MRTPNLGTVFYAPGDPSGIRDIPGLVRFMQEREQRVAAAINALAAGHLDQVHTEPTKRRDGDLRYADGSDWDPGAGKGIYAYNGSAWVQMVAL